MAQFLNPIRPRIDLIKTDDKDLDQMQRNADRAYRLMSINPVVQGNWFTDIPVVGNVEFTVAHGLAAPYRGYAVTRTQGVNQIIVRDGMQTDPGKTIVLRPSATGTIDLYIF